jgi:hypothetical protein
MLLFLLHTGPCCLYCCSSCCLYCCLYCCLHCLYCCRWHGDNGPRPTDLEGPLNLIKACPKTLKRFVFVTSAGVERQKEFPWAILNTFGEQSYCCCSRSWDGSQLAPVCTAWHIMHTCTLCAVIAQCGILMQGLSVSDQQCNIGNITAGRLLPNSLPGSTEG